MILDILHHTPAWVFLLLLALTVLGTRLARPTVVPLARLIALPCVFTALSLSSLVQTFGVASFAIAAWAAGFATIVAAGVARGPRADVGYATATRRFAVPGSWLPLALMLSIFVTRYAVAVCVAIDPASRERTAFVLATGLAYGLLSGAFAARALRIGRVALQRPVATSAVAA